MATPLPLDIEGIGSRALFESEAPAELFHYTDLDGIAGILASRSLWLSKVSTLNDTSEVNLAVHHFRALAEDATKRAPNAEGKLLAFAAEQLEHVRRTNICVGSFCEEPDSLSQWRFYGNDGRGIAIGFDSRELARMAQEHDVRLVRCVYDPEEHLEITRDLAGLLLDAYRSTRPDNDREVRELVTRFVSTFLLIAPVIKDHHFGLEREWRLVSMPRAPDDRRITALLTGNVASVKFVMPLTREGESESRIISSLVVGPTLDPENIADAVDVLARHSGFRIPDVRFSRIPYRPNR